MSATLEDHGRTIRILSYRGCIVEPIRQEGLTKSGLYAADAYDRHTPFVLARILVTHEACRDVKPGDVVITSPHAFETVTHNTGQFYLMAESNAQAVIEGWDEAAEQYAENLFSQGEGDDEHPQQHELANQGA